MTQQLRPEFQRVIELANETDLNTVREGGFYLVQYPTNAPEVDSSYVLTVYATRIGGRRKTLQVAMDVFSGVTSYRVDDGSWSEYGSGGGGGPVDAEDVVYDNGDSGLTATDLQEAVDELKELFDTASSITNLSVSRDGTTVTVANSSGDDAVLPAASTTQAGVLTATDKTKLDSVASGAQVNVPTNLSPSRDGTSVTIGSSTGTGATIPAATTSFAGAMTAADKVKLSGIESGATADQTGAEIVTAINSQLGHDDWQDPQPDGADIVAAIDAELGSDDWQTGGAAQNLSKTNNTTTVTVAIDGGTSAVLTAADGSNAGIMTAAQATKLAGIETEATGDQSGAEIVDAIDLELGNTDWRDTTPVNLGQSRSSTTVTVTNTAGDDATLTAADGSNAGIMTAADKTKLDGIEAGAEVNPSNAAIVSAINAELGSTVWQSGGSSGAGTVTTRAVADANVTIATALNSGDTLDGVTLADGDRVLLTAQSDATENGIYTVGASPARTSGYDTYDDLVGLQVVVLEGTTYEGTMWINADSTGGTIEVDDLTFVQTASTPTNLSVTRDASSVTINSSTGTGAGIAAADGSNAGVMTPTQFTKLAGIQSGAQVNEATDITISRSSTAVSVNSSTGADGNIAAADTSNAGVMTAAMVTKLNSLEAGAQITDITINHGPDEVTVQSSDGTDGVINAATDTTAGVMSADDKAKLDGIEAGAQITDLGVNHTVSTVIITSSDGDDATINAVSDTLAGVMLPAQKTKLDGIEAGAQKTNITISHNSDNVVVLSSDGTDGTINAATTSVAGVMSSSDKIKLDGIEANATGDMTGAEIVAAIDSELGSTDWQEAGGGGGGGTDISITRDNTTVTVNSSTGNDDSIAAADGTNAGVMTSAMFTKLDGIEAGADVTDAANVSAAGAVMKSLYDANTILYATTNDTPAALTVANSTIVGRKASGDISAMSASETNAVLGLTNAVKSDATANFTKGFTTTAYDIGTVTTGTTTLDVTNGQYQKLNCNGAFQLEPPSASGAYSMLLEITMGASAGAITMDSSWNEINGVDFTTNSGDVFYVQILKFEDFVQATITQVGSGGGGSGNLSDDTYANLTAGFSATAYDLGTKSSGTLELDPENGNYQRVICGGAFQFVAPTHANDYQILLAVTNNGSAGNKTHTGFDLVDGNPFNNTNGETFFVQMTKLNGVVTMTVKNITTPSAISAADVGYDNVTSGLTATDVQAAIDELAASGGGGSGNLSDDTYANLTAGFSATAYDLGTKASGTLELDPEDGNFQRVINNGAFSLVAPTHANDYQILLIIENDSSAGAITPDGFTLVDGNAFTTTDNEIFFAQITKINGTTTLTVKNVTTPSTGDAGTPADDSDVWEATPDLLFTTGLIESASVPQMLTDASTITVNWQAGANFYVTLTDNRTLGLPTNGIPGTWRHLTVYQDAGGTNTMTPHASYRLPGGEITQPDPGSNAVSFFSIFCDKDGNFHLLPTGIGMATA